jgi:hypothetical protein
VKWFILQGALGGPSQRLSIRESTLRWIVLIAA